MLGPSYKDQAWGISLVFDGPFKILAAVLVLPILVPVFFPLSILLGYPTLVLVAFWIGVRWLMGRIEFPAIVVATWATYLGLIPILHGIILGTDVALAGAPPSESEKRFAARVAYLGGAIATPAVIAAYSLDRRRRTTQARKVKTAWGEQELC